MLTTKEHQRPDGIAAARSLPPPFVGRAHELAQLSAVLRGSRSGRAWLVLVAGERGLGKTRLAAELGERAARDGARVLFGRCRPGRRLAPGWSWTRSPVDFAFEPARQSLFLAASDRQPPESVETHDGRGDRWRADVIAQVRAELRKAPVQPLLVVLDDLHHADAPTVTALARLMRELKCAPLLVIGLYRSAETRPSPPLGGVITRLESEGVHLALPPLSEEETAMLTEAIAARRLEPQVVTGIYRATNGNPLLTRAVVGLLNRESAQQPLELPPVSARDRAGQALIAIEEPVLPSVGYLLEVPNRIDPDQLGGSAIESRHAPIAKFYRQGDYWMLTYGDEHALVHDRKGLRYVAYLLCYPQKEIHVLDLVSFIASGKACLLPLLGREDSATNYDRSFEGTRAGGLGDAGELLDQQAKCAYKQRLTELAEELRQVKKDGDEQRAVQLEDELVAIERELRRAFGPHGRARVAASVAERARVNVTRTVRLAIDQIASSSPKLARYLNGSIRTGYFCSYRPDPDCSIRWQL